MTEAKIGEMLLSATDNTPEAGRGEAGPSDRFQKDHGSVDSLILDF